MSIEYNIVIRDIPYLIYFQGNDDILKLEIEQTNNSTYWTGEFDNQYIEELTNRVGSYKGFNVFFLQNI